MSPRVVKDPAHPDFPHGQERGYFRGCKDDCCRDAHLRAGKRRALLNAQGRAVTVPAGPVREHVRAVLDAGATRGAVLRASGDVFDLRSLCDLLGTAGRPSARRRISAVVARRLLAVTVDDALACHPYVDKAESVRLVRCLQAQGWTLRYIAGRLTPGTTAKAPDFLNENACSQVRAATARAVRALADEIGDRQGPSAKSATTARRLGFYPLIAYDDDGVLHREWLVDSGQPAVGARKETLAGDWMRAISLSLDGRSAEDIAAVLGVSARTVERARERSGLTFRVSSEWGNVTAAAGQDPQVRAARAVVADWLGGDVEARAAWASLRAAVAAAAEDDAAAA